MKILIAGSSGLVGQQLIPVLRGAGHETVCLIRDRSQLSAGNAYWNPAAGEIDPALVESCDAIINLAGESIAAGRWTAAKKRRIRESRVAATSTLASALAPPPPARAR